MYEDETILRGELPSVNGMCSARGLAELGALVLAGGDNGKHRIFGKVERASTGVTKEKKLCISQETCDKLHSEPKLARDYGFDVQGMSPTEFTKGGVNYYRYQGPE